MEKYWYDANGQRVKKQNSAGELTCYVNQFYEIENDTATSYFFRDDKRIAKQTAKIMNTLPNLSLIHLSTYHQSVIHITDNYI